MSLYTILKEKFGFDMFRDGQQEIIEQVIQRQEVLAILPTGGGKSLCYELPAYYIDGAVIIISPLVSLMEDQVALIKRRGEKKVVALNSFLSYEERLVTVQRLHEYKFIFISPEMLMQPQTLSKLETMTIAYTVVDEAHCISQWGFDFRPEYLRIKEFLKRLPMKQVLALTATADDQVIADIKSYLQLTDAYIHKNSLDRENLSYWIVAKESEDEKRATLLEHVTSTVGPGIVYVSSRKKSEQYALLFKENNLRCEAYHAGMEQIDRSFVQQQFIQGELDWVIATTAFGMGIHKSDIRQVIHEHIPSSMANYVQEVGRAGRDGQLAIALLLYTERDKSKGHFIVENTVPDEEKVRYYARLLTQESHNIAAQLAGLNETEQRVIDYYLATLSEDHVIEQLAKQKAKKAEEFQRVIRFIMTDCCYREQLLHVFGESEQRVNKVCCSNCNIEFPLWLAAQVHSKQKAVLMNWGERLEKLLL